MSSKIRVAAAVPQLFLCNVPKNVDAHLALLEQAYAEGVRLAVFPALSLTGATCGDLFFQPTLLEGAQAGLERLAREIPEGVAAVVGAPVREGGALRNVAVLVRRGSVQVVAHGPADRWFTAGQAAGTFALEGASWAVAIGDAPVPAADAVLRLEAVPEVAGGWALRRAALLRESDGRPVLCAGAGSGESTADGVYAGRALIASQGRLLEETPAYAQEGVLLAADVLPGVPAPQPAQIDPAPAYDPRQPFLPEDPDLCADHCRQIFEMQGHALARRLQITGGRVVVGISGGLDSTLALLAACRAMDILRLPRTNILGVTMPCFGTTDWPYQSALDLMTTLGVSQKEVRIHESVRLHFRDIGHDESVHDVTYENAQARERTQVLMDLSNQFGGIVLGTGGMSEIALGWCTYNGDHMSMYGVNSGVPKTVVRRVVGVVSDLPDFAASHDVLHRILDTPISPELLPPDEKGNIAQQTEDLVGPYVLHDFFLYHILQGRLAPKEVYGLCCEVFGGEYDRETIRKWLRNFYRRFFTQQFKRNCAPDGVAVLPIGLSPRGGWCMPSDGQAALWLTACDEV